MAVSLADLLFSLFVLIDLFDQVGEIVNTEVLYFAVVLLQLQMIHKLFDIFYSLVGDVFQNELKHNIEPYHSIVLATILRLGLIEHIFIFVGLSL